MTTERYWFKNCSTEPD